MAKFKPPTIEEIEAYAKTIDFVIDGEEFYAYYEQRGWRPSGCRVQMKSWKAAVVTWKKRHLKYQSSDPNPHKRTAAQVKAYAKRMGVEM